MAAPYRIIFMGTPDFALPSLRSLTENPLLDIIAVFCQPDRKAGRGKKVSASPVKKLTSELGIPLHQPESLKPQKEIEPLFQQLKPDCIVVVAYGLFLPRWLLNLPRCGCLNLHPSLLPTYRGPSPINFSLLNGDLETGITIITINEQMDAGDIVHQTTFKISLDDTYQTLYDKLSLFGAQELTKITPKWINGEIKASPQNHNLATFTQLINKSDGQIDWSKNSKIIANQVRAFDPWPSSFTFLNNRRVRLFNHTFDLPSFDKKKYRPGQIIITQDIIVVRTGDEFIGFKEIQMEGKKRLKVKEFLIGNTLSQEAQFENQ